VIFPAVLTTLPE